MVAANTVAAKRGERARGMPGTLASGDGDDIGENHIPAA
jgi:hypothetical protein